MTGMSEKLTKLEERQRQLNEQIRAEKAKLRTQQRKDETRRKVIVGAIVREHMDRFPDDDASRKIAALLDSHVSKPGDRELLGLVPREDATAGSDAEKTDTAKAETASTEPGAKPVPEAPPPPEPEKPKAKSGLGFSWPNSRS